MGEGLLIVNADDWGYDETTTEAIAACHEEGALSSTTAMMFMAGTDHAAHRAADLPELGIGLHLNLDEEYSAADMPWEQRMRQRRLVPYFRRSRLRRWLFDPRVRGQVELIVVDQLRRFEELYGCPPTHVDGHHHAHLAANVLLSRALPRGVKLRRTRTDTERRGAAARAIRGARDRLLLRNHPSTEYLFDLRRIWPDLGGGPAEPFLQTAERASVEIMAHPGLSDERLALSSPEWRAAVAGLPLGTFDSL